MKREDLYLTLEQCQYLQKLGLNMSDAVSGWYPVQIGITDDGFPIYSEKEFTIEDRDIDNSYNIPTYTFQEVLESLPRYQDDLKLRVGINHIYYVCMSSGKSVKGYRFSTISGFFKSAYYLLCWLLENKLLEEEER